MFLVGAEGAQRGTGGVYFLSLIVVAALCS